MKQIKKCSLLENLISRGDHIEVINGQLAITPVSKLEIPKQRIANNTDNLIIAITELCECDVYIFDGYSTGHYGSHKSPGITLQFVNIVTGEQCYVTFNAELKKVEQRSKEKKALAYLKANFVLVKNISSTTFGFQQA